MSLQQILEKIAREEIPILLCEGEKEWDANDLLSTLTPLRLKTQAHLQSGLYIAEINQGGYLGRVLYRIKIKTA